MQGAHLETRRLWTLIALVGLGGRLWVHICVTMCELRMCRHLYGCHMAANTLQAVVHHVSAVTPDGSLLQ